MDIIIPDRDLLPVIDQPVELELDHIQVIFEEALRRNGDPVQPWEVDEQGLPDGILCGKGNDSAV
jgi:hypothetical protein